MAQLVHCPWLAADDPSLIHPADLAAAKASPPFGEAAQALPSATDGFTTIRYRGGDLRVKPELLSIVAESAFGYRDPVVTVPPRTAVRGRIARIVWHHGERLCHYYLEVDGRVRSARYLAAELSSCRD